MPPVVPYALTFAGIGLVAAAIQGRSPIGELSAAFSGQPSPGRTATVPPSSGSSSAGVTTAGTGDNDNDKRTPPPLVALPYNNGHRVSPAMAARFTAWVAAFGEPIYVTDSYRSYAQQSADYAKDPDRFGKPGTSLHVEGNAVDVHLPKMGANYNGNATEKVRYVKLWQAAKRVGLCAAGYNLDEPQYLNNARKDGTQNEPWHFGTRCG